MFNTTITLRYHKPADEYIKSTRKNQMNKYNYGTLLLFVSLTQQCLYVITK